MKELDTVSARMSTEFLESLCFDLTYSLTRNSELASYLLECMHLSAIQTKSHHDDLFLTRREKIEHIIEVFFENREICRFFRGEILIIFYEVTKGRILFSADRGVE